MLILPLVVDGELLLVVLLVLVVEVVAVESEFVAQPTMARAKRRFVTMVFMGISLTS